MVHLGGNKRREILFEFFTMQLRKVNLNTAMVKILATLKNSCAKAFESGIEKVYLPCFGNKFFLPLFDLLKTCSLKPSYLQQFKLWKKKFIAKTLGQIHPSNNRFKFLYQIPSLGTGTLQYWQYLDHYTISKKMFHLPIILNLHIPRKMVTCGNIQTLPSI